MSSVTSSLLIYEICMIQDVVKIDGIDSFIEKTKMKAVILL